MIIGMFIAITFIGIVWGASGCISYWTSEKNSRKELLTFYRSSWIGWFLAVIAFIPLIAGALSLQNLNRNSMQLVSSGEYRLEKDCYGKATEMLGSVNIKNKEFFRSCIVEGDGHIMDSSEVLIEGNRYSLYRKDAFLHYNWIVLCDN